MSDNEDLIEFFRQRDRRRFVAALFIAAGVLFVLLMMRDGVL